MSNPLIKGLQQLAEKLMPGDTPRKKAERANELLKTAVQAMKQEDYDSARLFYEAALDICREISNQRGITLILHDLGIVAAYQNDPARARSYREQSLAAARNLNDPTVLAYALLGLATSAHIRGEL